MKWWGDPWPSANERASVCASDADRIDVPVGEKCGMCEEKIAADDRGVSIGGIDAKGKSTSVNIHKECFLHSVLGCSSNLMTPGVHHHDYETPGWYRRDARLVEAWVEQQR